MKGDPMNATDETTAKIIALAADRDKMLMKMAREAEKPFGTRVQLAYDYDKAIYILLVISEYEIQSTKEVTLELAYEIFQKWHVKIGLPIYAYGRWLAEQIQRDTGYPALWF